VGTMGRGASFVANVGAKSKRQWGGRLLNPQPFWGILWGGQSQKTKHEWGGRGNCLGGEFRTGHSDLLKERQKGRMGFQTTAAKKERQRGAATSVGKKGPQEGRTRAGNNRNKRRTRSTQDEKGWGAWSDHLRA